jgi:hypothetical protein
MKLSTKVLIWLTILPLGVLAAHRLTREPPWEPPLEQEDGAQQKQSSESQPPKIQQDPVTVNDYVIEIKKLREDAVRISHGKYDANGEILFHIDTLPERIRCSEDFREKVGKIDSRLAKIDCSSSKKTR